MVNILLNQSEEENKPYSPSTNILNSQSSTLSQTSKEEQNKFLNSLDDSQYQKMVDYHKQGYSFDQAKNMLDSDKKEQQKYLESLDDAQYNKMLDYYNQGYSFEDAQNMLINGTSTTGKTLKGKTVGGGRRGLINPTETEQARYNITKQDSSTAGDVLDYANIPGAFTEMLDNQVQKIPNFNIQDRRSELQKQVDNLSKEQKADYKKERESFDPATQSYFGSLNKYMLSQEAGVLDSIFETWKEDEESKDDFNIKNTIGNIPGSLIKTASAITRAVTNPADTLEGIGALGGDVIDNGRNSMLAQEYATTEGWKNALQNDPVGRVSDVVGAIAGGAGIAKGIVSGAVRGGAKLGADASKLARLSKTAGKLGRASEVLDNISDLGITNLYKGEGGLLDKVTGKLAQGNKLSRTAGAVLELSQRPLKTIWKGTSKYELKDKDGNTIEQQSIKGVHNLVEKVIEHGKEKYKDFASGLTAEKRQRIQQNPYIKPLRDETVKKLESEGASFNDQVVVEKMFQDLGDELVKRIDKYEQQLSDTGEGYEALKSNPATFNLSKAVADIRQLLFEEGIKTNSKGKLESSKYHTPEELNALNLVWDFIQKARLHNTNFRNYHDLRRGIDKLAKYDKGGSAQNVKLIQKVRSMIDNEAKKQIPGLKEIDDTYSKEIRELNKIKEGLVYRQGDRKGTYRDNFMSILKNLGGQNRQVMKGRLEERIFPGIGEQVEAINMIPELVKSYQGSPALMKVFGKIIGAGGGFGTSFIKGALSFLLGSLADELIIRPLGEKMRKKVIDNLMKEMTPEAQQKLADIESKRQAGIELTEEDKKVLEMGLNKIAQAVKLETEIQPKIDKEVEKKKKIDEEEKRKKAEETWKKQEEEQKKVQEEMDSFLNEREKELETIKDEEVDYSQLSDETLNKLREDDTIPQTEKDKIENILMDRVQNEITREAQKGQAKTTAFTKTDAEFIRRAHQLQEMEQNIGKVGKNKVGAETKEKQRKHREDQRDKLIQEIKEAYKLDQYEAHDKYDQFVNAGIDEEYLTKRGGRQTADKKAEKEIIDKLNMKRGQWNKQPAFLKGFSQKALDTREYYHTLLDGYEIQAVDKGDRIVKNGETVGNITYKQDGTIDSVIVKDLGNFIKQKKLLQDLPADTQIRVATDKNSISAKDLREIEGIQEPKYQKYGIANQNEKDIKGQEGLSMENFKNGRTVEQIAKDYGIETNIVDRIATPEGEKALGMYADGLITLAKDIKEGTAPHELGHAVFDLVDKKRKEQILGIIKKKLEREGDENFINSKNKDLDAEERLMDKFSEYFRTGKFEERGRPKGMWNKIKEFFSRVKDFITGVYKEKKTIKNLFDDIIENRIEHDMVNELLKNEADTSVANKSQNLYQTSSLRKVHINDENSSQYLEKISDLKTKIDNGEIAPSELLLELKKILGDTGNDSEYVKVHAPNGTHILRVSDHYANSRNQKGHKYRNLSLVLKDITDTYRPDGITKDRFHGSEKIGMNEYVYDTKNMNTAKIHEILDGIQQLINEGHYTSRNADLVHRTKLAPAKYQVTQKSLFDDDLTQPKTTKDIKKESEEWLKKTREEDEDGDMRGYLNQISTDKDFYIKDRYYKDKGAEMHQHLMDFFNNHTFEEIEKYVNKKDSGFNHSEANMILKTKQYLDGDNLTVNDKLKDASHPLRDGVFKKLYGGTKENAKRNHLIETESSEQLLKQIDRIKDIYKHAQAKGVEIGHRFDKRKEPIEKLIENEKINLEKEKELKPYFDKIDDSFKHLGDYYLSHLKGIMEDYNGDMLDWKMNLKVSGYMADEIKAMHLDDLTDYIRDFFKDKDLNDYSDVMTDTEKKFIQRVLNKDFAPDVDTEQEIDNIFTKYENTMASIRDKLLSYHPSTKTEELTKIRKNLFDIIGKTYDPDVQKRQDNIYEEMKQYGEKTLQKNNGEFRKAHIDTVDTQDLTSLKSMFKELKNYEKYNDRILGEKIEGSLRFNTPQGIYQDYLRTRDPNIQNKETVQQLVALSNMDENKLTQIVKDKGKIPMPSIAIMNPDIHHVDFGPIQFVFGKDTVDPKTNKKNVIYGTDAYTPTFPAGSVYSKSTVDYDDLNLMNGIDEKIYFSILRENMDQITDAQARDITEKIVEQLREDKASTEKEIQRSIEEGLKNWKRLKKPDNAEFITANVNLKYDIFDFLQENGTMSDQTFIKGTEYSDGRDRLLTPENLLKAMKEGQPATRREVKPGSYKDMIQIIGSKIDDLEDVRKKNFGDFKFHEIEDQIQKLNEKYDEQVSNLEEEWDYHGKNIRQAIKKAYDPDAKKFAENLNQNGNAYGTVSENTTQGLLDTIEKGRQSSIRFSESKPQRIVDAYKEVQYILIPSFMKDKVQEIVKGTPLENKVKTYNTIGADDRDDSARTNALHDIQKKYGNVFFSMGGIVMPIAYLLQMMNGENEEGQEG